MDFTASIWRAHEILSQIDHVRIVLVQELTDADRAQAEKAARDLIESYQKLRTEHCVKSVEGELRHVIDLLKQMDTGTGAWEGVPLSDDLRMFAKASARNLLVLLEKCRNGKNSSARYRSFRAEVLMEPVIVLPPMAPTPPASSPTNLPTAPSATALLNPTATATAPVSGVHCALHGLG